MAKKGSKATAKVLGERLIKERRRNKRLVQVNTSLTLLIEDHLTDEEEELTSVPETISDAQLLETEQGKRKEVEETLKSAREEFLRVTRDAESQAKKDIRQREETIVDLNARLEVALVDSNTRTVVKLRRRIKRLREDHKTATDQMKRRIELALAEAESLRFGFKSSKDGTCRGCGKVFHFPWPCPECQIKIYDSVRESIEAEEQEASDGEATPKEAVPANS